MQKSIGDSFTSRYGINKLDALGSAFDFRKNLLDEQEPSHLPIILASGLMDQCVPVPWWNNLPLRLTTYQGPEKPANP
jgi:hypothetical protein